MEALSLVPGKYLKMGMQVLSFFALKEGGVNKQKETENFLMICEAPVCVLLRIVL